MKYVYRIVNALLAAAVFPAVIFLDFMIVRASTTIVDAGVEESINIQRIINILMGNDRISEFVDGFGSGGFTWPEAFAPINARLISAVAFFAVALLCALFIIIWSACSNKRIPVLSAAALGLVSTIIMICCFNSASAAITSGAINVVTAFGSGWIASLLGGFVNIDTLAFGGFQNGMIILFVCLIIWTVVFYLIELGETPQDKINDKKKKH